LRNVILINLFVLSLAFPVMAQEEAQSRVASESLIAKADDSWVECFFKASPDGRHWAYVAKTDDKQFVFVDGKKGKQIRGVLKSNLIFSPNSRRIAYVARADDKQFVAVDGKC
jgi:hypothetical protein